MLQEESVIEAEVLEIDGIKVAPTQKQTKKTTATSTWQAKVLGLDPRWWPLWLLLGIIVVTLVLTLGIFVALIVLLWRVLRSLYFSLFRPITSGGHQSGK